MLSLGFALIWLSNLVNYSLISIGKQSVLFWTACVGLAVNVSVNLVMIPVYGKEGAAATTALTEATILVVALVALSRYMGDGHRSGLQEGCCPSPAYRRSWRMRCRFPGSQKRLWWGCCSASASRS